MARISLQGISKESPRNLQGISASLALLLAACGGGGNLTTSSQPEPEPPVIGPLVPSSEGDGEQQKIIVIQQEEPEEDEQNEESEEIIDIIIEQPEEEEKEEENQETQIQQITIIEEEDIPYVPPEEKEYERSPQTQTTNGLNIGEEFTIDRVTTTLEGSFPAGPTGGGAFPFGLWASEKLMGTEHRIAFLELSGFLNPTTRPGIYTPHQTLTGNIFYKREDGFKGIYIYEGETGELTGDVNLAVSFSQPASSDQGVEVVGNISTELEIEGNDLSGIVLGFGQVTSTTGVGGLPPELVATGLAFLKFGKTNFTSNQTDLATMHDQGQAKLRMVLSPDGRHAIGSVPESYPSYVAGEVEINGFKINADDRDTNTVVGVFIGDKQEQ